jgi:hypothetical protein
MKTTKKIGILIVANLPAVDPENMEIFSWLIGNKNKTPLPEPGHSGSVST